MLRLSTRVGCWSTLFSIGIASVAPAQAPCVPDGCLPGTSNTAPAKDNLAGPEDELAPAQPRRPVMFAAPAPSGEIAGARRSIALPSLTVSIPKISIETPEFRINGWRKFRRDAQMQVDEATAPAATGNPVLFGQLMATQNQTARPFNDQTARPSNDRTASPAENLAPPESAPCTLRQGADDVRQLSQQVQQLQTLVLQMAEIQAAAAQGSALSRQAPPPSQDVSYRAGRRFDRSTLEPSAAEIEAQEARLRLEQEFIRKCNELDAMQARFDEMERQHQQLLEKNADRIVSERESRLRQRLEQQESGIVQSSFESEEPLENTPRRFPSPTGGVRRPSRPANATAPQADEAGRSRLYP